MTDLRPVFFICGIVLATLAGVMLVPAIVDAAAGNDDWQAFALSSLLTVFVAGAFILTNRGEALRLDLRQAFVFTTMSWLIVAAFAALPLAFAKLGLSYTDAFFEAMSGITTTGSTVIAGLDNAPPGILLWRAILQWMGGIGIIVVALAILPMLQVGGMQLFRMESSDTSDKVMPRTTQIAAAIAAIYLVLSIICAVAYWVAGMSPFEAAAHAMTTIATGGFSTSDASLGHFNNAAIEWIAVLFMIMGGMPFVLYLQAVRGKPGEFLRDGQVHWFLGIIVISIVALVLWRMESAGIAPGLALRRTAFNVVSIITGTGYSTEDFGLWGGFAVAAFFIFMFIGGCAGSTSCGIKIFRFQVLFATSNMQVRRLIQPHGVFIPYYNRRPIPDEVTASVMGFFFLFVLSFIVLALVLGLIGLDFMTAVSGAATAIANVGPGLGEVIGPAGTFATLPDTAKWLLAAGMLLGRLELFTVLVLFVPSFWRR